MFEASFYDRLPGNRVRCMLCPHYCRLADGQKGICLTRRNIGGRLISLNYCRPVSAAVDPIEKKPLYHFLPGSTIFSTGPNGCNFKCEFCQNCEISQHVLETREIPAETIVGQIVSSGTIGAAYTYSEPFIWFETIMAVAPAVREQGLKNVLVTNGFVESAPLDELIPFIDAMNIDIKSMEPAFYRRLCKARLEPVLRTCEFVKKRCHLEITNLIIPGENDSEELISRLARYIAENLGRDTPLHLSRYFPRHRYTAPPTPKATILAAWKIARQFLDYVYIGNLESGTGSDTVCPSCAATVIRRTGHAAVVLSTGRSRSGALSCPQCSAEIPVILA